jgi:MFS family permease
MLSVAWLGMAVGEVGWGWLADRIGIRIAMLAGTVFTGLSVLMFVFTESIPVIFIIFIVWGFLRSAIFGPVRGYIGAYSPPEKKATFMAFSAVMLSASSSLGALPSGFLADSLGYHSVFYTSLGASLIGGLIVIVTIKNRSAHSAGTRYETTVKPMPQEKKFSFFSLTPQCIVTALMFLGKGFALTFLSLFATKVVGIDIAMVGILFTVDGITNLTLSVPMGMLADRLGKKSMMIIGLAISAGAMAGIAFADSFGWIVLCMILNGAGMAAFSPAALSLFSDSVPHHRQNTAMGLYGGICENVGILGGSALGGVIWESLGYQFTFFTGAIACGLAAIACYVLIRNQKTSTIILPD